MQTRVAFFLLLFLWGLGESNQNLLIADSCYFRRADNAFGDKANIVLIQKMVQSYKDALKDTSVHEKASLGLLKSYYFMIRFASPNTKNQRKELIKTAKDFAHISHEHYPKNIEITRSEEHTSELQSRPHLVCRLLLEKKKNERKPIAFSV